MSYYSTTNNDLKVAKYVGTGGTGCATTAWTCTAIDTASDVGLENDIAIAPDNKPWISFYDNWNENLRVAKYVGSGGTGCASTAWTCTNVDITGDRGHYSSLVFDNSGMAWISYLDGTNADLRLAKYLGSGGSGCASTAWTCVSVDTSGYVGYYTSVALDPQGRPWVSYYKSDGGDLKVARYVATGGAGCATSAWTCTSVDTTSDTGYFSAIAFDPQGVPMVGYYDNWDESIRTARFVTSGGSGCASTAWSCKTVDTAGDTGKYPSIAFDKAGSPWISYTDATNRDLRMAGPARSGEMKLVASPTAANGDAIGESHLDMQTTTDSVNRDDADCMTAGKVWSNGKWFENDSATGINLASNKCTEVAFVLDASNAAIGTSYRFAIATDDSFEKPKGFWRGSAVTTASPVVTISAAVPNQGPTADFTATPTNGTAPLNVNFDAAASNDSDGTIISYAWDYGDGQTGTGKTTSHSYSAPASYTAVLTVTDDDNATATKSQVIMASAPATTTTSTTSTTTTSTTTSTTTTAPSGALAFKLSWSGNADLDLLVTEPNGNVNYYGNPGPSASGGRAPADDKCPGAGSHEEATTWSSSPPAGVYELKVDQYDNCGGPAVNWTLQVIKNGTVVQTNSGTGSTTSDISYTGA